MRSKGFFGVCHRCRGKGRLRGGEAISEVRGSSESALAGQAKPIRVGYGGIANALISPSRFIGAVTGVALGGGFEIVIACDLVIAAPTRAVRMPEPVVAPLRGRRIASPDADR